MKQGTWSYDEVRLLRAMKELGFSNYDIADRLGRRLKSVEAKIHWLRHRWSAGQRTVQRCDSSDVVRATPHYTDDPRSLAEPYRPFRMARPLDIVIRSSAWWV